MRHHVGIQFRYRDLDPDGLNARGNPVSCAAIIALRTKGDRDDQ